MKKIASIAIVFMSLANLAVFCQENVGDSLHKDLILMPYHKNVIKFNPTPMLLFDQLKNITFSYERIIRNNQSINLQAGYLSFDGIFSDTVAGLIKFEEEPKQPGINIALEYRYYLPFRNRRPAPDGLFIGGYVNYYGFKLRNSFEITDISIEQDNEIKGNYNAAGLGFCLGYQFIFWKRLAVDLLLFGPSAQYTSTKGEINGNLDQEQIEEIDEELIKKLLETYPVLGQIYGDQELSFSTKKATFGLGFRYSIQVGYHF